MSGPITRRRMLKGLGATGAVGLAGCTEGDGTPTGGDGGDGSDGSDGSESDGMDGGDGSDMTPTETNTATGTPGGDVSGTVRIGVLQPMSGDLQYYGQQSIWGFLSGLAYKADSEPPGDVGTGTTTYSVGDVDYELLVRDTQFSPDAAESAAETLVRENDVDM
ncbi:branched-chain amino acid ABC transporter substrate-binding protein, partial [Halobacteriales archaeon QH_1_68_42]